MRLALGQLVQCQYQVSGIALDAGVPVCTAAQLAAQEAELQSQEDLSVPQGQPLQISPLPASVLAASAPTQSVTPIYTSSPIVSPPMIPAGTVAPTAAPVTTQAITQATTAAPLDLSTTSVVTTVEDWFTASMIPGIPNWALAAGGVLLLVFLMKGKR
jgi:hypothetical protein